MANFLLDWPPTQSVLSSLLNLSRALINFTVRQTEGAKKTSRLLETEFPVKLNLISSGRKKVIDMVSVMFCFIQYRRANEILIIKKRSEGP